ncbi:hypothetical protein GF415_00685 [Candidatus Micrarchaeota archaeon]|nr:hypothetical protein [Candidatus Micrarchaeota archaeon]
MSRQIDSIRLNFVINRTSQPLKRANREFSRATSKLRTQIGREHEKIDRLILNVTSFPAFILNERELYKAQVELAALNRKKFIQSGFEEKLEGAYAGVMWSTKEAKDRFSEWADDQDLFMNKVGELHDNFLQLIEKRYLRASDALGVIDPKILDQMIDAHIERMRQLGEIARMTAHLGVAASIFNLRFPQRQRAGYGDALETLPEVMEQAYPKLHLMSIAAQGKEKVAEALLEMLYPGESEELIENCFAIETIKSEIEKAPEEEQGGSPAPAKPQKPEMSKSEVRKRLAEILSSSLENGADKGAKMCLKYLEREEWLEILEEPENMARVVHRHPELQSELDKIKDLPGEEREEMPREQNEMDVLRMFEFSEAVKNEIRADGLNIREVKMAIIYGFKLASAKKAIGKAYFPSAVVEGNVRNAIDDGKGRPGGRANEILDFLKSHGVASTDKNGNTMMINTVESKGQAHSITPIGDEILSATKKWMVEFEKEKSGNGS